MARRGCGVGLGFRFGLFGERLGGGLVIAGELEVGEGFEGLEEALDARGFIGAGIALVGGGAGRGVRAGPRGVEAGQPGEGIGGATGGFEDAQAQGEVLGVFGDLREFGLVLPQDLAEGGGRVGEVGRGGELDAEGAGAEDGTEGVMGFLSGEI